ncbi:prestin-like [Tropilaelaps mercedesae]|uniref:Prestin-like n=1 Tax=Tropilaelaps mercedesae TaxID=418985 RepID=A0A1V9X226_9ACAR|nr:prestin-like [Tropilaelaps mercedesae]
MRFRDLAHRIIQPKDIQNNGSNLDNGVNRRHHFSEKDFKKLRKCCSESSETPICRPVFNQPHFDTYSGPIVKEKANKFDQAKTYVKEALSSEKLKSHALAFFPIISWMRHYNIKSDLIADIICGLTVAIFHVPQTIGYTMIVGVPLINGLYTALFPMLMYAIFGTSRQNSIGAFAVVCIMTQGVVRKTLAEFDNTYDPVQVVTTLALFVGLFQFLMGCLSMGGLSVFLSEQFVSGFTAGVSVHIGSSQLSGLGFNVHKYSGPFLLFQTYADFFTHLDQLHWPTLVFSLSIIAIILAVKIFIDPYMLRKFHMPLPIEMIMLITSVIVSNEMNLKQYGFVTIDNIPDRLQAPSVPSLRLELVQFILLDAFLISVVAFTVDVSLGRIWARERGYEIRPNQEFFALGISNFFGSLFGCFPAGASVPRSSLQLLAGGRTQLVSLINSSLMFVVILALGKHLEGLPVATLSAIIVVSLKKVFMQVRDFKNFWNLSIIDGHVWLVSFFATVVIDTVNGLIIGVVFSLLTLVYKVQRPKTFLLGGLPNSDYYVPIKLYVYAREVPGVKIFQFGGPLHFANSEFFRYELVRKCGVDYGVSLNMALSLHFPPNIGRQISQKQVQYIVLDFSRITFVDGSSALVLKQIIDTMKSQGVTVFIAACAPAIFSILKKSGLLTVIAATEFYPTVHDAVMHTHESHSLSSQRSQPYRHRHLSSIGRVASFNETFGPDSLKTEVHDGESEADDMAFEDRRHNDDRSDERQSQNQDQGTKADGSESGDRSGAANMQASSPRAYEQAIQLFEGEDENIGSGEARQLTRPDVVRL